MSRKTWVGILSDFVRKNPRTSAMIAFNLGVWAAQATKKSLGRADLGELPSKLAELVPSMKDIGAYMPALPMAAKPTPARRRRKGPKRSAKRRSARKRAA